jgi:CBS domain-containing protein
MGKLLPNHRNATFSGSGCFNPLCNDPSYETIGVGTRIFLGGAQGYIIGEGTQHDPGGRFGTLMVKGDCKEMNSEFIRGASFTKYGNTLYVGLGVPIPILNEGLAKQTAVTDDDIFTNIVDYGVPRRGRPTLGKVSYKQLKSGSVSLQNKEMKVSPLSSLKKAHEIADLLKQWINNAQFYLTSPVENLPKDTIVKPMKQTREVIFVESLIKPAVTCLISESITEIAERLVSRSVNHIIVIDDTGRLEGIVTSWDITRAIANGLTKLTDIITTRVVTSDPNEPIEAASRRMAQHNISALPVVDQNKVVLGILTSEDLSKLVGG